MKLNPEHQYYLDNEVEVFFEEGQIVLEMHDLDVIGTGIIGLAKEGKVESMAVMAPVRTANVIITPSFVQKGEITMPKFTIEEVKLEVLSDQLQFQMGEDPQILALENEVRAVVVKQIKVLTESFK